MMSKRFYTTRATALRCCLLATLVLGMLSAGSVNAQNVNVAGALVGNGTYATLGAAFAAINGGAQGGANIAVTIVANTNEGTASAVLNQSSAPWATLTIQPSGGAFTVTGATTAGQPLIDLSGADNVTIDGLNSSGNALTIQNTTVATTSGTSTIRFIGDATNNVITRCAIQGSSTMTTTTNGGTIWFAAGAVTTGNDNNTISFCDIGPAGTNLPAKAIYGNGTTTNTTTYNSGNQILNCNIFDYFHATAQSNGFYIGAGNTGMTVSNNKLYQTANRTQTSGAIHAGIQFASATGNDGNLVSGNTIGFANNAGTGTYTLVGASGTRVYPIYLSAVGTNTVNVVSGNTISNISVSGVLSGTSSSAPFIGIFFSSGLANAIGNTIGSGTANGAISFSSSSATASDVMAIYNFGSSATTVSTNIIGGITAGNTSTANVIIYGIRINTASAVVSTIQGNQIGGAVPNSIQNTTLVSTSSQAIGIQINLSIGNIIGNTIGSMSVSGGNGTGSTPSVGGIVIGTSTPAHTVIGNTIAGIGNLNPASSGHVSGIVFNGSSGANLVAKNTIHSLVVTSAAATLNGIFVTGGTTTYANNMIRLGLDPTGASLTSGAAINGINETTAGTDNFYHNSVYIGGSGVGGAANTFAFQSSITTNTRNFQNNIFFNARSNGAGTGKHYAIRVGGIAPNPAGLTSNFNVLFANGTGGLVGLFNSVDQASISSWRIATGQDNNSISFNPGFVNPNGNGLTGDLHIAPGATPIEGAGVNIPAVTDDFDSQTRSGLTPTDIGADAGAFTALDVSPPNISYTPLTFTCTTGDRTLTATIADATGIPISGAFQPRIYYRKNADPYVSSQGVLSSGTANNGTWTFTISTAAMGGLVGGDVVSYYVIAQDDALPTPNVASNPSAGLVATDVNTVTTPPTTPSSYAISLTLSGTYTVGAAGDYPTLTAAVNAYNSNCLGGAVIFSLIDASYPGETFPITVLSNPDASAINTLTIKPTLTGTTITGSNVGGILNMSGADYVTIDGSIGTTANTVCPLSAATRDLTITNTLSSTSTAVVWLSTTAGGNPVTNCTVKNCIISGLSPSTTLLGLGAGGPGIGAAGTNNDNISFVNNEVRACQVGIYSSGATAINKNQNLTINQNLLNAVAPNNIGFSGIYAAFTNNITVSGNVVSNVSNTASTDVSAINIGFGAVGGFLATTTGIADGVSNVTITNNTIGSILQSGTFSSVGIGLGNTLTGNFLIANNMIYGVAANATPGDLVAGILYGGGSGTVNVFNNSVWMQGTIPGASAGTSVSACFAVTSATAPAALNLRNNIFHNTQQGNTGSTMRFVTIGYQFPGPFTTASSNYNDLFSAGAGPGTYFVGTTAGLTAGTTAATLANWQTATSGDANSLNIAPVFVSSTDLHLIPASNSTINDLGTPVGGVTSDIDCATRSVSTPDMGADEFDPPVCAGTPIPGTATLSSATICQGFPTTLSTTGYSTGVSGISFQWQTSTTIGGPYTNIPGATTPTFIYSGAAAGVNYIVCQVTCSNGGASALTNELTLTVNPSPVTSVTPANSSICLPGGSAVTLTASATGGTGVVNFTWNPTTDLTPSIGSPVSANPSVTTIYTVTGTDAIGCSSTATATVGVGSTVTIANVTATPSTICAGSTSVLDVEATVNFSSNYGISNVPFASIPSGSGTTTLASGGTASTPLTAGGLDDGYWNGIAMPFAFNYFGTAYTTLHVGTNGYVSFAPITTGTGFANTPQIPNALAPNNIIGGCFGDLDWAFGGVISTYTSGVAPNRVFVINFNGSTGGGFYNLGTLPTALTNFQIQLFETSNLIQVQTVSITANTINHTMGIENVGGTAGFVVTGRNNSLWSLSNEGTQFAPIGNFTYAWTPSLGLTPSATVKSPTTPALSNTTTFNVTVSDASGCSATGNVAVTVNPTVVPAVSIVASPGTTICAGDAVTFTATPVNPGTTPIYQWKKNGSNVGTNATTYTDGGLLNGDLITVELTSNETCAAPATVTSNTLTMTVNPLLTPSVTIAANPGTTICAGTSVTFTATPVNGGSTPAYQWKKNGGNVGTNSTTYSDNGLLNGDVITVELTSNAVCATPTTVTSNTLTMVVNPVLTPSVSISANPGVSICAGTNVTFTAAPTNGGSTPVYQWKKNGGNVGTNSATYSDNGLLNGDVITVELTSSEPCASPTTVTSNTLTISVVTNTTPTVSITASPGSTICPGSSATFTATAVDAGLTPSYQWLLNGSPVGTNSSTYTNGSLVTADEIICEVTSSDPCALPLMATSNTITMIVDDLTDPIAVCQAVTVTLDGSGNGSTTAAAVNNGSNDNCTLAGSLGLSLSTTNYACAQVGINTAVLTVTDGAGRTGTCSATITVVDNILPVISCPANVSVNNSVGQCNATVTYATPSGTDNCTPTTTQTAGLASGASFPVGTTTNTFRATDASGNSATCAFTVTVADIEAPSITCPANTTLNAGSNCDALLTYTTPAGTDNCTGATTVQIAGVASGTVVPLGTTTNTFRVTDGAGNTATCSFTVVVSDVTAPTAVCQPVTVSLNGGGTGTTSAAAINNASSDNCTLAGSLVLSLSSSSFSCADLGTNTVTLTVADAASNTGTCTATVTVVDNVLPAITCPANISVNAGVGVCNATVTFTAPVGTDNCTPTTTQTAGLASGASYPVGVTTNAFNVTDGSSNSSTCSFTITVTDTELPTITCPANVTVSNDPGLCGAVVTYTSPNGADNCTATTTQVAGLASGTTFPVGTTTNSFTVTDGSSNTATCSFTVTVNDTESPAWAVCPANITVSTSANTCDAAVSWTAPTATDNCSVVNASSTQTPGSTFAQGTTTVTYTADDAAGNLGTCTFDVTVNDSVAPDAICQSVTVTLDVNGSGSIVTGDIDNGSTDNCAIGTLALSQTAFTCANAGANTVTLLVTDASGNTGTCTATVTVVAQPVSGVVTADTTTCGYNVSCAGGSDGVATAAGGGGCPSYTYLWSNSQTTATATGLGAGTHTVTITDGAGGTFVGTVTLTEPAPVAAAVGTVVSTCFGESTGSADITPSGGNDCQGYTFVWSNGATSEDLSNVAAGTYTVTVTDANGCTGTQTVTVGSFAALNPTFTVAGNILTSTQTWSSYQWLLGGSNISGATANTYTALTSGVYSLSVTDANGCTAVTDTATVVVVGIADPSADDLGLSIYPNPARGEFKLRTESPIGFGLTVSIHDMYGHQFLEQVLPGLGQEVAFDIKGFSAGSYIVEVVSKHGQRTMFRLVVQ